MRDPQKVLAALARTEAKRKEKLKNPKARKHKAALDRKWRARNPAKVEAARVLNRFGPSAQEHYKIQGQKQENRCAICNRPMAKPNRDHCHNSQNLRGLLCRECNIGLGLFGDSIELLSKAIAYLQFWNATPAPCGVGASSSGPAPSLHP